MLRLESFLKQFRARTAELRKSRQVEVSCSTVDSVLGGMKNMKGLFYDSSSFSRDGLRLRGKKFAEAEYGVDLEGMFYYSLTGQTLSSEEAKEFSEIIRNRSQVPAHVSTTLASLPNSINPLIAFSIGVLDLQKDSHFLRQQSEGLQKKDQYKPALEDALDLLAKTPEVAAKVFSRKYGVSKEARVTDIGGKLAEQIGVDPEVLRYILCLRAEKEGGRIDVYAANCVNSTLSDPYLSYASAVNAFAAPILSSGLSTSIDQLHSLKHEGSGLKLAQQFVSTPRYRSVYSNFTYSLSDVDSRLRSLKDFVVFRPLSPLIELSLEVGRGLEQVMSKDQATALEFDLLTGAVLHTAGLKQAEFYPVIDALSSGVTTLANIVLYRAMAAPILYPVSIDLTTIEELVSKC